MLHTERAEVEKAVREGLQCANTDADLAWRLGRVRGTVCSFPNPPVGSQQNWLKPESPGPKFTAIPLSPAEVGSERQPVDRVPR